VLLVGQLTTLAYTGRLHVTTCWCGLPHAIPESLYAQAENHGRSIYCPLGHQWIVKDTFEQKLRREQQRHEATRDLLAQEERSHAATRGHLTRTKKRVGAGVCPCCHRTFRQLARHMEAKHPDYGGGA
jgi:hypothetical protein